VFTCDSFVMPAAWLTIIQARDPLYRHDQPR
jgi:hypothetical protein